MVIEVIPIVKINKKKIFKRLRIQEETPVYEEANKLFDQLYQLAMENVDYTLMYTVKDSINNFGSEELDMCEKHIYCFATVGESICNTNEKLFKDGKIFEGYLFHDIVNELLLVASNYMFKEIKKFMKGKGYNLTRRFSPGENNINIIHQHTIMNVIKEETNIRAILTDGYMIKPEKSILYIYGADSKLEETEIDHDCNFCTRENCIYRK